MLYVLLTLVVLILASLLTIWLLCDVKKVTYTGNTLYTDETIEPYVFTDEYCQNTVYCYLKNRFFNRISIPFVEQVTVQMTDANSLTVEVKEKELTGMMIDSEGAFVYFDSENRIAEISGQLIPNIPLVAMADVKIEGEAVGDALPLKSKRAKELKNIFSDLKDEGIFVANVLFADDGTIAMSYGDIVIDLGTSSNLDAKILRLKYILPQLEGEKGTLHLEDWDEGNRDIVFEKAE